MLAAWVLSYWLCDNPGTGECRPGPAARELVDERACLAAGRAVRLAVAAAAAVHCHRLGPIVHVAAPVRAAGGKPSCPGDQVVWVNTHTHVYHVEGSRWFGTTKAGKYACRKDADREGDRVTRGE